MKRLVDEYWRQALGWIPGSTGVMAVPGLPDYEGIYVLAIEDGVCVATPVAVDLTDVRMWQVMTPAWWHEALGRRVEVVLGPSIHHYLDQVGGLPPATAEPVAESALAQLKQACPQAEWNEGGFGEEHAEYFAVTADGRVVAAANLTWWNGAFADIGVITHPGHRGRGYGRAAAVSAARQAISRSGIARYRALESNGASLAIAARLGFLPYGADLAIRLGPSTDAGPESETDSGSEMVEGSFE